MDIVAVFEELLYIVSPFQIRQIDKDEANRKVQVYVEISTGHRPLGFEEWYIHRYNEREWEHLNVFKYRCFIHCKVPIYQHRVTKETVQLKTDFSREYSRFT